MTSHTEEEYTTTPKGFCRFEVDVDQDLIESMIDCWVQNNLTDASIELYEELSTEGEQSDALYAAIVNDNLIKALTAKINQAEAE